MTADRINDLQYKMFLLNLRKTMKQIRELNLFTIQNVSIKF